MRTRLGGPNVVCFFREAFSAFPAITVPSNQPLDFPTKPAIFNVKATVDSSCLDLVCYTKIKDSGRREEFQVLLRDGEGSALKVGWEFWRKRIKFTHVLIIAFTVSHLAPNQHTKNHKKNPSQIGPFAYTLRISFSTLIENKYMCEMSERMNSSALPLLVLPLSPLYCQVALLNETRTLAEIQLVLPYSHSKDSLSKNRSFYQHPY